MDIIVETRKLKERIIAISSFFCIQTIQSWNFARFSNRSVSQCAGSACVFSKKTCKVGGDFGD